MGSSEVTVARMKRSAIRGSYIRRTTVPGFRFASSGYESGNARTYFSRNERMNWSLIGFIR